MCSQTVFYDSFLRGGGEKRQLKVLCKRQMLRCCFLKSLSLAIIYTILEKFADHAHSCADLKRSVLHNLRSSCWWEGKRNSSHLLRFTGSEVSSCVFPVHLACVTPTRCFNCVPCEPTPLCHTYYANSCSLLITESLFLSYYTRIFNCVEDYQPSVVVIIAHWDVDINEMMQM